MLSSLLDQKFHEWNPTNTGSTLVPGICLFIEKKQDYSYLILWSHKNQKSLKSFCLHYFLHILNSPVSLVLLHIDVFTHPFLKEIFPPQWPISLHIVEIFHLLPLTWGLISFVAFCFLNLAALQNRSQH